MKKYIIYSLVISLIAASGFVAFVGRKSTYQSGQTQTKVETKEVQVDALDRAVKDAIAASSTEIENKAKAAYDAAKHQAELEIELSVRTADQKKKDEKIKELQKESVAY